MVPVPAGATTGNVVVTVKGVASNGLSFTVTSPAPSITSVSPSTGPVGSSVTIAGANFGTTQGTVTFNGVAATPTSWSAASIVALVPSGATTGNVVVTAGGQTSNGVLFTVGSVAPVAFMQANYAVPRTPQTTVTVTYTSAQTAGNLNVVVAGWNDSTAKVSSVMDSQGNAYVLAVGPTVQSGTATQAIYYAKNIAAAPANGNTVTVTFNTGATYPDIRIAEYSGIDPSVAVDVVAAGQGSGTLSNSGLVTTGNANDLLVGANLVQTLTSGPGTGYTSRLITKPDGDILEDSIVTTTGSYGATAPLSGGAWIMQMVAFRAAGGGGAGAAPSITSLSPVSGPVGTPVTIAGANFGTTQGTSTVTFNGMPATPTSWNATSITAPVPGGATTGNVVVTVGGRASNAVSFSVTQATAITVTVSPKRAAVTTSQVQQFTATVSNDPQRGSVTWSVDGNNGGTSTSGTISSTGLFSPGTQPGLHVVTATSNTDISVSADASIAVTDLTGVFTYHNDSARTGQNLKEYALSPATVNSATFGVLFSCPADGYLYASPLYVANLNVGGQTRNVVFIATEHNSVYAFDADSSACVQLWHTSFLSSGVTTVPPADTGETGTSLPKSASLRRPSLIPRPTRSTSCPRPRKRWVQAAPMAIPATSTACTHWT